MPTLKIEQGSEIPSFPGFVAGLDHEGGNKDGKVVAIRVAPAEGKARDVLTSLNVRTIRVGVAEGVNIRSGDDVLLPAMTIRRVQAIELKDKSDPTGQNRVPMFRLDAAGQPIKGPDGNPVPWLTVNVALKGPLAVSQSRVKPSQIVEEIDDKALAAANAAW